MKSLKQTQEEELETAEPYLGRQAISKLLIKHSMPTRQVFISEITALIREFLLSAMESAARGAEDNILEYLKDRLDKGYELKTVVEGLEANLFVHRATKAEDYIKEFDNQIPREGL